ncbi:NAD(P)-dependent oxidoreductase [Kribbella sp. NBC_01245]|uniref:NAD-dependent epimerase/dehydratase family protein n=1 Tax=Kribbella sp. NBC_01245 TaxID=2903578 RepID=UPI002E2A3302|nr:NAD(P)-dependent oxidoreductase [Kribbella sp. NBC_01245]
MSSLTGKRVLVTGATGRIGSMLVPHLNELGAVVTTLSANADPTLKADRVLVGDTRSETDVADALEGVEFVVHLAAIAHRDAGTPYDVYSTNVVSTFNVLAQAGAAGIRRAVVASSINAYGVPMNHHDVYPAYFPLDERIPVDVDDWYSLSKLNDENTARMAWRHWGIDVVSLRFPHVHSPEALTRQSEWYREDPVQGMREGWAYLDTRDAARVIELGLTVPLTGAHVVLVAAPTTNAPYRTEDLLRAFARGVPRLRGFVGREVPMDLTVARTLLGFQAVYELDLGDGEVLDG